MNFPKILPIPVHPVALSAGIACADAFPTYEYGYMDSSGGALGNHGAGDAENGWSEVSWDLTSMWHNRYVTEGRRRVKDAHFLMTDAALHLGPLNLGAWWAQALTESSYSRLDAYANSSFRFDAGLLTLDLRRVFYPTGKDDHSWEAGVGFDFNTDSWFTPFARTYYDFEEIRGGFLETGVKASFDLFDKIRLTPFALLGVDYGYVNRGDNRPQMNHFQLGTEMRWDLGSRWQLHGYLSHSFSLSGLDDFENGDVTWGGTGVRFRF